MVLSLVTQIKILVFNILAGVLAGVLFDIYRLIRGSNYKKIIGVVEDILFWILASILIFLFLSYSNYAYFGFYCYVYIVMGLIIHKRFFSCHFCSMIIKSIKFECKIFRIVMNIIIYYLKMLLKIIGIKKL